VLREVEVKGMNKKAISNMMIAGIIVVVLIVAAVGVYIVMRPPWAQAKPKVGLILATGGLGDKSFNDISYAGVVKAKTDLGIDFDYVQPTDIAQYEGYQRDFARSGDYAIIIGIGFDQLEPLNKVAAEYPDQKFALVDETCDKPNVASLRTKANEGSFLVGVVAGMKTKTGKVGFVGGMDIPLIQDFYKGYKAGVEWANSSATVLPPVFVGEWANPTKGKETALALIGQGVDAIFPAAGRSGLGALLAVNETGIIGFGVDACQCYLYPEIKASMTKRVDLEVYEMIKATVDGTFKGGVYNGGLKEKWVGLCRLPSEEAFWEDKFDFQHSALEQEVTDKIVEANTKISWQNGTIVVPSAF
jgi:basic membrane protein A